MTEAKKPVLLLVEDDDLLQDVIERIFRKEAEVVAVATCEQAIEVAGSRRSEIKAILVDYSLRGETTEGIISLFRHQFGAAFPIFGWSGDEDGRRRQKALGCTQVFEKPIFDPQVLDPIADALTRP